MAEFDEPLFLDVTDDLERVDGVMTRLVNDRPLWDDFLADPNGVMIRLGLHPETTSEISARVNRAMWACLADPELMGLLGERYRTFTPERLEELQRYFVDGLREGVIRHEVDYDLQAIQHLLDDTDVLQRILRRTLAVMHRADAMEDEHTDAELDEYVESVVQALIARAPVRDHPKLEVWDEYYGIGQEGGGQLYGEGASVLTVFVGVQGVAYVTALLEVGFWGVVAERAMREAISGDEGSVRAVAMLGRVLDLGGELLVHAQNYRPEGG
jgi:hypothetical protein